MFAGRNTSSTFVVLFFHYSWMHCATSRKERGFDSHWDFSLA